MPIDPRTITGRRGAYELMYPTPQGDPKTVSSRPAAYELLRQASGAGAGRGFINPPMADPRQPMPTPAAPALSPLPVMEIQSRPVMEVIAEEPSQAPQEAPMGLSVPAPSPISQAMTGGTSIFDRLNARPDSQAIYDGAIQAGIGLLGSKGDIAKGLASGFQGFNQSYDERMQAIKAANTPKVTPLANGSFALLQYPDGRTEVRSFEEVQKFLLEQEQAKALPTLLPKLIDQQNKAQEKAVAARNNYRNVADKTSFLISQIDKALPNVDWTSAGLIGQLTSFIGGTPGANLEALLNPIKGNLGFAELQAMRDASPTGGALGQVAVKELELLTSIQGSLEQKQEPGQLAATLKEIRDLVSTRQARLRQAYLEDVKAGRIAPGTIPELEGGSAPAAPTSVPQSGASKPSMTVPGLSPGAQKYFQ